MWGAIIGGGLSLLGSVLGNNSKKSSSSSNSSSGYQLSYKDALSQAEDVLKPQYEESKENTLNQLDNNMINTGFYGQAPGDAIKADTMADMETDFQSQLSQYATELQDRQFKKNYQEYQLQNQQQEQTFGNIGTGAAIGQQIGEGFGESGWGTGIGALAGWLFS